MESRVMLFSPFFYELKWKEHCKHVYPGNADSKQDSIIYILFARFWPTHVVLEETQEAAEVRDKKQEHLLEE